MYSRTTTRKAEARSRGMHPETVPRVPGLMNSQMAARLPQRSEGIKMLVSHEHGIAVLRLGAGLLRVALVLHLLLVPTHGLRLCHRGLVLVHWRLRKTTVLPHIVLEVAVGRVLRGILGALLHNTAHVVESSLQLRPAEPTAVVEVQRGHVQAHLVGHG